MEKFWAGGETQSERKREGFYTPSIHIDFFVVAEDESKDFTSTAVLKFGRECPRRRGTMEKVDRKVLNDMTGWVADIPRNIMRTWHRTKKNLDTRKDL